MKTSVQQTIKHWGYVTPYAHIPKNETEYKKLLTFVDELMKYSRQHKDNRVTSLLQLIAQNIEAYETQHYPTEPISPIEMLKFLMEEHGLGQGDLPEIGSQSLVSKILSGDRQLTVEHIRHLSKRFGVSPSVFY
jgi:HTH-type transcriptional regulator/antitoxin HigA